MPSKSAHVRFLYFVRDWRSRALFDALRAHCRGHVLDVGGWDFAETAIEKGVPFERWTTLDSAADRLPAIADARVHAVQGDGCRMEFADASFDTALAVQVLEHVFDPIRMVEEIGRVLKPGGAAILLVPQTSSTHLAPSYFGNFSRWWIEAALERAGLELVELRPLGGLWSSAASHAFYFFLQSARVEGFSDPACRRGVLFYALWPIMALFALASIPICLVLSLGDLSEEPNNHLVVARRRADAGAS